MENKLHNGKHTELKKLQCFSMLDKYASIKKDISNLLNTTVEEGEANSALIIGPRGCGKTTLVNAILNKLQDEDYFKKCAAVVRLHGLIHTDDKLALKAIATQLNLDNVMDGKLLGTFAENLVFLFACLRTGEKKQSKSILFILEEFDCFCNHHKQTLIYNLFDIVQSSQISMCVLGITCRLDVIELFEKRVKSRFSHRQYLLFSDENVDDSKSTDSILKKIKRVLMIDSHNGQLQNTNIKKRKSHIRDLTSNKRFITFAERLTSLSSTEECFKSIIYAVINKIDEDISVSDFEAALRDYEKDDLTILVQDLSVLEILLLIAMKHHCDIYDEQPFNFEMILTRYLKFVKANSGIQAVEIPVLLKAFEHIQQLELITHVHSTKNNFLKEYKLFQLLMMPHQLENAINKVSHLPTEVKQWAFRSSFD